MHAESAELCACCAQASCWSDYYWAVTLPVELQPPGGTVTPVAPALASLTLTLRTAGGAFEEAASLGATFAEGLHIPCRVDPSSGAVSVSENATAPSVQQQQQQLPMPGLKGMVLVHTVWGSFLDGLGAPPRPPPAWLTPLGWLPLLRLCGPGVPLLTLSSLLTAARMAELRSGPLVGAPSSGACAWPFAATDPAPPRAALLVPAMLAAAAEAASAVVAEARVSARERAVAGRSLLPVAAALAYVACGALLVAACVAEPLLRELRRAWRAADAVAYDLAVEHPLGEPLRRAADGRGPYTRSHAHARSTQAARPEQPRTSQI